MDQRDSTQILVPPQGLHHAQGTLVGATLRPIRSERPFTAKSIAQRLATRGDKSRANPDLLARRLTRASRIAWSKIPSATAAGAEWTREARRDAYPVLVAGERAVPLRRRASVLPPRLAGGSALSAHVSIATDRQPASRRASMRVCGRIRHRPGRGAASPYRPHAEIVRFKDNHDSADPVGATVKPARPDVHWSGQVPPVIYSQARPTARRAYATPRKPAIGVLNRNPGRARGTRDRLGDVVKMTGVPESAIRPRRQDGLQELFRRLRPFFGTAGQPKRGGAIDHEVSALRQSGLAESRSVIGPSSTDGGRTDVTRLVCRLDREQREKGRERSGREEKDRQDKRK